MAHLEHTLNPKTNIGEEVLDANEKTSIFEKISYGMGDVACNVVYALTAGLVTYFYTNVMGISASLVGGILLLSRVLDGVADVAIGLIMDKVNSRHGRGRAWVLWMAFPYGLSAVALFCLPPNATETVQAIYIFISYNLCSSIIYVALNLPYGAMAPLMTRDEQDLAKINLFRMAMSPIGNMIVSVATIPIINHMGGGQDAWIKVIIIYSTVAVALLLWCFFGTKERVRTQAAKEAENLPIKTRFVAMFKNKYFIIMLLCSTFLAGYFTVIGTSTAYYAQYILGNNEYYSALMLAENIPQVIVIIFLAPFIKRFGKRNLVLAGAVTIIIAQIFLMLIPATPSHAIEVAIVRGIAKAPLFGCICTMLADVINYGHWKTNIRLQGLIFCASTVGSKLGAGLAGAAIGWFMGHSGYTGKAVESPAATSMIENLYIWGAVIPWILIAVLMVLYRLDKHYDGMIADMERKGMFRQQA